MDRERALAIAREIFPEENRRGCLNILFEHTLYPAYDPDLDDHEPLLRAELADYRPKYEEKKARLGVTSATPIEEPVEEIQTTA